MPGRAVDKTEMWKYSRVTKRVLQVPPEGFGIRDLGLVIVGYDFGFMFSF